MKYTTKSLQKKFGGIWINNGLYNNCVCDQNEPAVIDNIIATYYSPDNTFWKFVRDRGAALSDIDVKRLIKIHTRMKSFL